MVMCRIIGFSLQFSGNIVLSQTFTALCCLHRLDQYIEPWEKELEGDDALIRYDQFQHVEKVKADGTKTTVMDRVEITSNILGFYEDFQLKLRSYIKHVHMWRWQARQYEACCKNLPVGHIIVALDFAENHTFLEKVEVQSLHWSANQATLLPMVVHRHAQVTDEEGNIKDEVIKEHFVFISDDKKKDTEFVMHAFGIMFQYLEDHGIKPRHTHIWTDGCAGQFKSHNGFMDKSLFRSLYGCTCDHNFFCSGHGKGEWDGVGATCKHCAALAVVQGKCLLKDSADLHQFLAETLTTPKSSSFPSRQQGGKVKNRLFFLIPPDEIKHEDRSIVDVKTIKNLRQQHQFFFSGHETQKVRYRRFTCMCEKCIKFDWKHCVQPEWVPKYTVADLKTKHARTLDTVRRCFQACEGEEHVQRKPRSEVPASGEDDALGNDSEVRDLEGERYTPVWQLVNPIGLPRQGRGDFDDAVATQLARCQMANAIVMFDDHVYEQQYQYFIFRCTEGPLVLDCTVEDDYQQKFNKGARVFKGYYFTLATDANGVVADQTNSSHYVLSTDKLAYVAVESVAYTGFEMLGTGLVQGLPIEGQYQRVYELAADVHKEAVCAVRAGKKWLYDESDSDEDEEDANAVQRVKGSRRAKSRSIRTRRVGTNLQNSNKGERPNGNGQEPMQQVAGGRDVDVQPRMPEVVETGVITDSDSDVDSFEEVQEDDDSSSFSLNDT